MPRHLHADIESFSKCDLKKGGAYRYANDPSTRILCASFALDYEPPAKWHCLMTDKEVDRLAPYWDALEDPATLIYAHNAMFELSMFLAHMRATWGIDPPAISRFRCTMSLARRAVLPGALDQLAETLGNIQQKDKRGKALLNKFTKLQTPRVSKKNPNPKPFRTKPEDDPAAFAELVEYCAQDVRTEQEVSRRLAFFGDALNDSNYTLDAIINARGVPVNLDALRHAQRIIDEESEIVSVQFRQLTGCEVGQLEEIRKWLSGEGYPLPNLQAETVDAFLEEWEGVEVIPPAVYAMQLRSSLSYAAVKKIPTMLYCAGPHDNRIRGMLNHHGAGTGRWTASLVQFQNMKRSSIKDWEGKNTSEDAYKAICGGISREMLDLTFGPPLEVIASCIRHFVQDI